ncbi:MAG TPA: hypothetical protein PLH19_08295 [Anaerolineae bacterium]|nr:hypothetical protein [Anaerolineae bacterium]HQH38514.1 hypothetical protein [Anaerolineae bacterium]
MFDALMFLAGAVLFLLAVLFSVYLWRERGTVIKQRLTLAEEQHTLKEKHVELEIWQKELQVWHNTLEQEQQHLEQEREEFRMLVASRHLADENERVLSAPLDALSGQDATLLKEDRWGKNLKRRVRIAR